MKNPINTNLNGKVAVVTGAGGVICSMLAKSLAEAGAKEAAEGTGMVVSGGRKSGMSG